MPTEREEPEQPEEEVDEEAQSREELDGVAYEILKAGDLRREAMAELEPFIADGWKEEVGEVWTKIGDAGMATLSMDVGEHEFTMTIFAGEFETAKVFASAEDAMAWFDDLVQVVHDPENRTGMKAAMRVADAKHEQGAGLWALGTRTDAILNLRARARRA